MLFSPAEILKLNRILERTHLTFLGSQLGTEVLSPHDIKVLLDHGINVNLLPKSGKVDFAFKFGLLAYALDKQKLKKMSFEELRKFIESDAFVPLSETEKFALRAVKQHAYSDIRGLESRITRDLSQSIITKRPLKRKKYEKIIKEQALTSVRTTATVSQMASELGHKTQDWARDLDRIADYVLHEAFDLGKAHSVQRQYGDDALVYKEVYRGACDHCQRLYLTDGIGSRPIIFKLSDLMANGNNIGRKVKEWLPVCGPTHPWCRCEIDSVPTGYAWDNQRKDFVIQRVKKIERTSRVKVTVTRM